MPTRVLVVDDSLTVRKRIVEVLSAAPDMEVVGEAGDGKRAIELCTKLRPDVVTLDMMLPVMTGLAATEYIMAYCPTPILIVSASTNRGELFRTYDALAAGAVDVLDKSPGDTMDADWEDKLVSTVKLVSRIRVITHLKAKMGSTADFRPPVPSQRARTPATHDVIAIGASTGGPAALTTVLRAFEPGVDAPVLMVLHIGEPFGLAFAEWLDAQTGVRVRYAADGEPVAAGVGQVRMARPNHHLVVRDGNLYNDRGPERHSCRPSVDVLFESVATEYGPRAIGALLTGMGRDGAQGLLRIRESGGTTIAQDHATSVVYGMPREAAEIGAVQRVLPLDEIGPALAAVAGQNRGPK